MGDIGRDTPVAVVSPLDSSLIARADAAVRLWRLLTGQRYGRQVDPLTPAFSSMVTSDRPPLTGGTSEDHGGTIMPDRLS
jgi:hypothetical protein